MIPRHLPFSGSNNAIVNFRHALSLDERRVKFIPFYCTSGKPKPQRTDSKTSEAASEKGPQKLERRQTSGASYHWELGVNDATGPPTNVKEVFFAGAHCGTSWFSCAQLIRYSRMPFQMSGVDLW